MKKLNYLFLITGIFFFTQSAFTQVKSIDTERLVNMMEGSFSSNEQSINDSDYFDIRLHMKRIWKDRTGEYWLYVEQAVAGSEDKPYRQRVYRISNTYEGRFESAVFTIPDPLRFAGDWKSDEPLSSLSPDSLTQKEGCSVILTLMNDGSYEGSTAEMGCESDLRGAKYATSEVKLTPDALISWDRGFDENDNQVWGAIKGGYIFKRIN